MDWIKIKTGHILNTGFPLVLIGALVKIQALTAHLERIPTQKELDREIPHRSCTALAQALERQGTSCAEVLHRVCEDCARVMEQRHTSSARIQKWRHEQKNSPLKCVTGSKQIDRERDRESSVTLTHSKATQKPGQFKRNLEKAIKLADKIQKRSRRLK